MVDPDGGGTRRQATLQQGVWQGHYRGIPQKRWILDHFCGIRTKCTERLAWKGSLLTAQCIQL